MTLFFQIVSLFAFLGIDISQYPCLLTVTLFVPIITTFSYHFDTFNNLLHNFTIHTIKS